jgi:pyrroline-5-carboxylate reductase
VRLAKEAGESLETLRKRVTSPGGTTEAALRILEGRQTRDSFIAAIAAATKRGKELSDS